MPVFDITKSTSSIQAFKNKVNWNSKLNICKISWTQSAKELISFWTFLSAWSFRLA